ncbi:TauD/TfdA family dioxygenase [Nocardia terpenica]|nr:TauD/TfdA family dioxygenase [Nocardia terpenica]
MSTCELGPGIASLSVEEREKRILGEACSEIERKLPYMTEVEFLNEIEQVGASCRDLLPDIAEKLARLSTHREESVLVLDFGAESVENVGSTPFRYHRKEETHNLYAPDILRGAIVGIANWYGYGYTTQQHGVIHNNVVPVKEYSEVQGISASTLELGLHVEDASFNRGEGLDISPDFLTMHFFRNDKSVPTTLSVSDWSQLSSDSRDLLCEEWYFNKTNPGQGGSSNDSVRPVSVLYGPSDHPWIRLNTADIDYDRYTAEQSAALRELVSNIESNSVEFPFSAGQVVIVDNRRVLHGRRRYDSQDVPRYDGTDRWQRRLVVSQDPSRLKKYEASSRLVDPRLLPSA